MIRSIFKSRSLMRSQSLFLAVILAISSTSVSAQERSRRGSNLPPAWEYNPGPDPSTASGRELIDLYAELPEYMLVSDALMDRQKFRYIFGLMMTRTYFDANAVKILFVGQDATHIAEAAKQPGTSGFGARVQSIGNYFGADESVATTNAFLSTINGQYGAFDHIFVELDKNGEPQIRQSAYVDNELWTLANSRKSRILIKREAFWEWMIKNNPESLSLMILFGGAARDAFAEFLIGRGAKVGTRMSPDRLKNLQVPETKLVYAGGNNEFPVPVDKDGNDIYAKLLGKAKLDYSKPEVQQQAVKALQDAGKKAIDMMVFTGGGLYGSGVLNAAQLGGYDLDDVYINGEKTNSLKGLVLSDGTVVNHEIGFTMSAHPSSLSKMEPEAASGALKKSFARLSDLKAKGWKVEPDAGWENRWDKGEAYEYGRADIRPGYFEFGAPDDRRVSRADASRLDPQTIIAGSRNRVRFDQRLLSAAKEGQPSDALDPNDLWSVRPRQKDTRYIFDRGPGKEIAKLIMSTLDRDVIFEPKSGQKVTQKGRDVTFETNGIDAYNTKTHPGTGFFGIHRGRFEKPRALILADPHGIDDWNTARALTGARGQYLNGLMSDLGYGEDYLVIKTVPVGMDGATDEEWEVVRGQTEKYREVAIEQALKNNTVEVIFTDGAVAKAEMQRVLEKLGIKGKTVIDIQRDGMAAESGIVDAGKKAKSKVRELAEKAVSGKMKDIPRSHLPWWSRSWEGCGGDHVIDAVGKERGGVRALVTPNYVVKQRVRALKSTSDSIAELLKELDDAGIRSDKENIGEFLARKGIGEGNFFEIEKKRVKTDSNESVQRGRPEGSTRRRASNRDGFCADKLNPEHNPIVD